MDADLFRLFRVDESDLVANRAGRLGPHQQAELVSQARRLTIGAWGGLGLLLAMGVLLIVQHNAWWWLFVVVGFVWAGLLLWLARQAAKGESDAVESLYGAVKVWKTTSSGPSTTVPTATMWLKVGDRTCLIQRPTSYDADEWMAVIGQAPIRVYMHGGPGTKLRYQAIAVERA